jgi:hypothetical protein
LGRPNVVLILGGVGASLDAIVPWDLGPDGGGRADDGGGRHSKVVGYARRAFLLGDIYTCILRPVYTLVSSHPQN